MNLSALDVGWCTTPSMDSTVISTQQAVVLARKSARGERRTLTLGYTGKRANRVLFVLAVSPPITRCMDSITISTGPGADTVNKKELKAKETTKVFM